MKKKITRRSFIKKGTLLGAGTLMGSQIMTAPVSGPVVGSVDISVVQGTDYFSNTIKAVDALGGMPRFVPKGAKVAILANPQRNNPGAFTRPDILRAVIRMSMEAGAKEVNCISWLPEKNWESTGLAEAVRAAKGKLHIVDLRDETLFKPIPVPRGIALKEAKIMQEFFLHDVFITVPITKDHAGNKFTGTLKNMMGLNSPKNNRTFHKENWKTDPHSIAHLDQCIADLNTVLTPDLCVVDATEFIITNGPFGPGKLCKPNKVVAGTDRVAVDAYCCSLWGLKGKDIMTIQKAAAHKLGTLDLSKVKIHEHKA